MSALFSWRERTKDHSPKVGDRRIVIRFLLWPTKLQGEWRWLGFDRIEQEFKRYRVQPPEMRAMDVVGWRDVEWAAAEPMPRGGIMLTNLKEVGRNGPPTHPRPPPPPNPPPTRLVGL